MSNSRCRTLLIVIILLSAVPGLASAASGLGAVSVISKPFHLKDLIAEVRRVLGPMNGTAHAGV